MQPIISNKIGSHIHSPFVYRLVANGLFSSYPFYAFEEIEKFTGSKIEFEEYQLIFRIINFFQPSGIQIIGDKENKLIKVCQLVNKKITIENTLSFQGKVIGEEYRCLIWHNYSYNKNHFPPEGGKEIWIIRKVNDKTIMTGFQELADNQQVSITIRLNQIGIIIFNDQYQKQNYVIKH